MRAMAVRLAVVTATLGGWIATAGPDVAADTATANLSVTASVVRNCTISTLPVAFGPYDPVVANATADLDATGSVSIACTKGTPATIGLSLGANATGSTRRLSDGADGFLTYELFKTSLRTTVWGSSGTDLLDAGAAPSRSSRAFTVYGRITAGQDATVGVYSDTVVATVNF